MPNLNLYEDYSREEVHDFFSPNTRFKPRVGTWGLQGFIAIHEEPENYVFFVTFGQHQGEHIFDEWITEEGVISWQSQPRQNIKDKTIRQFIHHNEKIHSIHLFLRTQKLAKYTYLGRLKYLVHHPDRNNPVYIFWQILDWNIPQEVVERMNLNLRRVDGGVYKTLQEALGSYNSQNEDSTQDSFMWDHKNWKVDRVALFDIIKTWIARGLPNEATSFRSWFIEVDGIPVSPKWVFHLITGASYYKFDAPTARIKLNQVGIASFQIQNTKNKAIATLLSNHKTKMERRRKKVDFSDSKHTILEQKVTEIKRYLSGELTTPTDEILCDWVSFCYSFELYDEGTNLFRMINPNNVNEWFYAKTKKLAKICELKRKPMDLPIWRPI